jgi:transposase-like protein
MQDDPLLFTPPFCPRSDCDSHRSCTPWRWRRHGFFTREASPHRIPRFRCGHCGHTFSFQTFRGDYWLKQPDVLIEAAHAVLACSGHRQTARAPGCAPNTIQNQVGRIGRQALLIQQELGSGDGLIREPIVIDGFQSFALSQQHPLYLNLVVGAHSHFCYAFTHSELRRAGRMTPKQRRRRDELETEYGRPDPKAIEMGTYRALRIAAPVPQHLVVRSDEHEAYPRVLKRLERLGYTITHERTNSRVARTAGNPLFPVNRLDLLLRHNSANHKRETIAFSKRHQAVVWRAAWLLAWQNFAKPYSERHGGGTPAMRAGLASRPIPVEELLRWRRFPWRAGLSEEWRRYYHGEVPTRRIRNERRHTLKFDCEK